MGKLRQAVKEKRENRKTSGGVRAGLGMISERGGINKTEPVGFDAKKEMK